MCKHFTNMRRQQKNVGLHVWVAFQVIYISGRVLDINIKRQRETQRAEILAMLAMFGDGNVVHNVLLSYLPLRKIDPFWIERLEHAFGVCCQKMKMVTLTFCGHWIMIMQYLLHRIQHSTIKQ
mmetsp:Transcript_14672/g.26573  ORF Transcript_14672/g.26573 Transcript_14672/m.26573 type:complete len:123 (-) Transcript_14672:276-644(-)